MKSKITQAAAMCYRITADGDRSILLVSSRTTGRWIFPKGNIEPDESPMECAAREAFEEAGIVGHTSSESAGSYSYSKGARRGQIGVAVFPLAVEREVGNYREKDERARSWFPAAEAAELVEAPELKLMIRGFDADTTIVDIA